MCKVYSFIIQYVIFAKKKKRRKCIYHRPLSLDLTFLQNPLRPTARTSYSLVYSMIHLLNVSYNPHHVLYSLLFSCVLLIIQYVNFAKKKRPCKYTEPNLLKLLINQKLLQTVSSFFELINAVSSYFMIN